MSKGPATRMHDALLAIAYNDTGIPGEIAGKVVDERLTTEQVVAMDVAAEVMADEELAGVEPYLGNLPGPKNERAVLRVLLEREVRRRSTGA